MLFAVSDVVVQLSFVPYLLVIDLFQEIVPADARLVLDRSSNMVTVHLRKAVVGPWGKLSLEADPEALASRREASLEREYERQRQLAAARANASGQQEREATRQQMAVEERARQVLTQRQQEEKETAQAEAVATLKAISREAEDMKKAHPAQSSTVPSATIFAAPSDGAVAVEPARSAQLDKQRAQGRKQILERETEDDTELTRRLVPPRAGHQISIKFTPRSFPTPLRESRAKEEEDWLAKNYLRLKTGPQGPDRPFVERDPAWLKDKGNSFAQAGDWPSADAAYTAALEAQPEDVGLLLNRALARVQQDKADAAAQDCSAVIAHVLGVPFNAEFDLGRCMTVQGSKVQSLPDKARGQVLKALGRVVLSRLRAGTYMLAQEALACLASVDLSHEVASEGCAERVQGLAAAEAHKAAGDGRVRAGDQAGAVDKYTEALALQPQYVQALLNKSAALHALCKWAECEAVCARALDVLSAAQPWATATLEPHFLTPIPCTGTALHSQCKTRAETRIADCRAKLAKQQQSAS